MMADTDVVKNYQKLVFSDIPPRLSPKIVSSELILTNTRQLF